MERKFGFLSVSTVRCDIGVRKRERLFWSELSRWIQERKRDGNHVVGLCILNARLVNEEVLGVMVSMTCREGMSVARYC